MADLAQALLAEEVRGLQHTRKSGILAVTQGEVIKALFFRGGQVVFASSTVEKDKLGENLIRLGRISRADFAAAYEVSQGRKQRLGRALVNAGVVTEEELGRIVAQQVQRIGVSLFTWTSGEAVFHPDDDPIPEDLAVQISTHRLLLEGIRIFPDVGRIRQALGNLERTLRLATRPPFDYSQVPLAPAEKAVLAEAADGMTVREIIEYKNPPPDLRVRALYTLLVGGVLEEATDSAPELVEEEMGFKLSAAAPPEPPPASLREQVLRAYETLPRATHYAVLGVPPEADGGTIDAAYRRLVSEQDKAWKDLLSDKQLSSVLSTLRLRRREAYQVLGDPNRRAAYDQALGALVPPKTRAEDVPAEEPATAPRHQRARALLDQGDRDSAIALLLEAVDVDPKDHLSRKELALALSVHPTLFRTAERHFLAALEQDPYDIDLRYRLAAFYRKQGLPTRAMTHLNLVLYQDSTHEKALRDMEALVSESGRRSRS